jgi:rubrerythrin
MTWSCGLLDLDVRAALDLAIMIEEDAALRYEALCALVGDDLGGAGAIFRELAANEQRHCGDLELMRDALRAGGEPRIEVSVLDAPQAEHPEADDDAPPRTARDALEIALAAERRAEAFYRDALPRLADRGARALFEDLAQEEAEHVALLERRLEALAPSAAPHLRPAPRLPAPPDPPTLDLEPDRAALEGVLPLFDAATQAVALGVLVEGLEPEQVAAALGVSHRTVARKLTRFVDLARRHLAAGFPRPAFTP